MSLNRIYAALRHVPDPLDGLAAGILAQAVDDLRQAKHQQDARRFLYSGWCEEICGALSVDYFEMQRMLRRYEQKPHINRHPGAVKKKVATEGNREHVTPFVIYQS